MKRWMRHTLAGGTYRDYDVVNCHPVLFVQYCQKQSWDTRPFEEYIAHRDECLEELCEKNTLNRDDAKAVVLSILNGGSKAYKALEFKPYWLQMYKGAVEDIQRKIMADP